MTVAHLAPALRAPSLASALGALRARGMRVSTARRQVLEELYTAEGPVSAEALAERLPGADLASVYRNLVVLEEVGLVRHVHLGHGPGRYALAGDDARVRRVRALRRARGVRSAPDRRRARADRARARLPPALHALPDRRRLRRLPGQGERPCTFLTGSCRTEVAVACAVPAAVAVGVGLKRANVELDERRVPLLGVTAAFIFAAQMLNFPVAGGTSGHFLGAALAAILLGPWLACLVLAVVLGVQAFVFADGGITALGANVLNMGVIGALLVGGLMYAARRIAGRGRTALLAIAGAGAWLAVMAGADRDRRSSSRSPARCRSARSCRRCSACTP